MGFTNTRIGLENLAGGARREVELPVDTGALYSIVPASVLKELGITPTQRLEFELADGRGMMRSVGEARFFFDGRNAVSNVIFGEESDAAVLGVVTLEQMGLEVDPARKQIRPTRLSCIRTGSLGPLDQGAILFISAFRRRIQIWLASLPIRLKWRARAVTPG